jgi:ribosomal protein L37AE/L43A
MMDFQKAVLNGNELTGRFGIKEGSQMNRKDEKLISLFRNDYTAKTYHQKRYVRLFFLN